MSPEQESKIFEDLGAIKTGVSNLHDLLDTHTAQDMTQFSAMTAAMDGIKTNVDKLVLDFSVAAAIKLEQDKATKKIAGVRAAWVSGAIGFVYTLMQIFVPMLWKH
jgi:hypothetical protein